MGTHAGSVTLGSDFWEPQILQMENGENWQIITPT